MDITNITQNLVQSLEQKNTEQLVALSRVLNLVLGKTVMATITATTPVTSSERAALLQQTAAALTQLNKQVVNPANLTPALKAEISRLVEQQNLIQSPKLQWVNLTLSNRPLLTYSDRPLITGQTIPVQMQGPNKLVLLDTVNIEKEEPLTNKNLPVNNIPTTKDMQIAQSPLQVKTQVSQVLINKLLNIETPTTDLKPTQNNNEKQTSGNTQTTTPNTPASTPNTTDNKLLKTVLTQLVNPVDAGKVTTQTPNLNANTAALTEPKSSTTAITNTTSNPAKIIAPDSNPVTPQPTDSKPVVTANSVVYSAKDLSLKFSTHTEQTKVSSEISVAKNTVSENFRNLLPHKDTPEILLSAITQFQRLPSTSRLQIVSPSVEQALKSIAEKIRAPEQLGQPKVLIPALKNTGVFFENKLAKTLATTHIPAAAVSEKATSAAINQVFTQDLKGSLLTLLARVTQDLTGQSKPLSSEQTLKLLQQVSTAASGYQPLPTPGQYPINKTELPLNISLFIQQLMNKPVKELSDKELRTQLLVLLQQHSVHSLAKIQLQQLHNISQELDNKDSPSTNASWQLEIPVKHHNDVQHLHLRIDREWIDEKHESESNKATTKVKQWSVTLRFDLPSLGEFCAQLAIIDTNVSATLWALKETTFIQVKEQIEGLRKQLESEGINVKYLQCLRGMPPQKPMALSYSLIDIST